MTFTSIRSRLVVLLLVLILPVLTLIYWIVERENLRYTDRTIDSYLAIGAEVFDFSLLEHRNTLWTISNALTRDWGFRNAFGAADPATIMDAAQNLLARSNGAADLMLVTDMQGRVIIDTHEQAFDVLPERWQQLLDKAAGYPDGYADQVMLVSGVPYQLTVIPLFLPTPVAWIFAGFPLDERFVTSISQSTASDISVISANYSLSTSEPVIRVIASSLSGLQRHDLESGLDTDARDTQRIILANEAFGSLIKPLSEFTPEEQIFAVVQRSYRENEENLRALQTRLLDFSALIISLCLLVVFLFANTFTRPVIALAARVRRIRAGDFAAAEPVPRLLGGDEITQLADSVEDMVAGLREKERVRSLLGKVVSSEIAEELLRRDVELRGEERFVAVLFVDIRGFTRLSESLAPPVVLEILNICLQEICDAIEQHNGVIDKFIGDAVMAIFGAPLSSGKDSCDAVQALLEVWKRLPKINSMLSAYDLVVDVSAGISSGIALAGNVGSASRLNYTVVGDTVNVASRIEALTRYYRLDALVGEDTVLDIGAQMSDVAWREVDTVRLAGRDQAITLFQPLDATLASNQGVIETLALHNQMLHCYRGRQWTSALDILRQLPGYGCDPLLQLYQARLETLIDNPPGSWDAIYSHQRK